MKTPFAVSLLFALGLAAGGCQTTGESAGGAGAWGKDMGVVYMHGRGVLPDGRGTLDLMSHMRSYGVTVVAPIMPWAGQDGIPDYTGSLDDALKQVAEEVAKLRAKGLKKVFVAGMSEGGRTAIAYGGHVGDADGIIAIAAAPDTSIQYGAWDAPHYKKFLATRPADAIARAQPSHKKSLEMLKLAKQMVAEGRGKERATFTDTNITNRGQFDYNVSAPAELYLSYIDPDGKNNMAAAAAKFKPGLPLFAALDNGTIGRYSAERAFEAAPKNDKSRIVAFGVAHSETPRAARDAVRAWLLQFAEPTPVAAKAPTS